MQDRPLEKGIRETPDVAPLPDLAGSLVAHIPTPRGRLRAVPVAGECPARCGCPRPGSSEVLLGRAC